MFMYSPNEQGLDWRRSIDILQLGIQKLKPRRSVAATMKVAMMMIGGIPSQKHHHHKKELYWECKFDNSTEPTKAWRTFLKNCLFLCCQVTIKIKSAIDTICHIFKISHCRLSCHAISVRDKFIRMIITRNSCFIGFPAGILSIIFSYKCFYEALKWLLFSEWYSQKWIIVSGLRDEMVRPNGNNGENMVAQLLTLTRTGYRTIKWNNG